MGNVIDRGLLAYFLREHYSDAYEELFGGTIQGDFLPPHYILRIIDNNVNFVDLTKNDKITVEKDGFKLGVKMEDAKTDTEDDTSVDTRDTVGGEMKQNVLPASMDSRSPFSELDADLIDPTGNDDMWNCGDTYNESPMPATI